MVKENEADYTEAIYWLVIMKNQKDSKIAAKLELDSVMSNQKNSMNIIKTNVCQGLEMIIVLENFNVMFGQMQTKFGKLEEPIFKLVLFINAQLNVLKEVEVQAFVFQD